MGRNTGHMTGKFKLSVAHTGGCTDISGEGVKAHCDFSGGNSGSSTYISRMRTPISPPLPDMDTTGLVLYVMWTFGNFHGCRVTARSCAFYTSLLTRRLLDPIDRDYSESAYTSTSLYNRSSFGDLTEAVRTIAST